VHEQPLFELEPPTRRAAEPTGRRSTTKRPDSDQIRWTSYTPKKRIPCDDCIQDLIAAGGGPPARDARYRRVQHGYDRVLCTAHMQLRRELDGLPALKTARAAS
jgi:hypothetical protein